MLTYIRSQRVMNERGMGLIDIETCLDKMKTKLAASITKIRIEKQALNLQFLLPPHLRDEKVARAVTSPIITAWFNKFKTNL